MMYLLFLGRLFMKKERVYEFDVVILEDESGGYIALVPALSYYYTQGDTIDEVVRDCYDRRLLVFRE